MKVSRGNIALLAYIAITGTKPYECEKGGFFFPPLPFFFLAYVSITETKPHECERGVIKRFEKARQFAAPDAPQSCS